MTLPLVLQTARACVSDFSLLTYPVYVDAKYDGVRAVISFEEGKVIIHSRGGLVMENFEEIEKAILPFFKNREDFIFDCEIVPDNGEFNDISARSRSGRGLRPDVTCKCYIFDVIEPQKREKTLRARTSLLKVLSVEENELVKIVSRKLVSDAKTLQEWVDHHLKLGLEGSMVKGPDTLYRGGRLDDWLKIKPFKSADLTIIDIQSGRYGTRLENSMGKVKAEGCLEDGTWISTHVGAGFTDKVRKDIWENPKKYLGKVIEVEYMGVTKKGSLRQPIFTRWRLDKS